MRVGGPTVPLIWGAILLALTAVLWIWSGDALAAGIFAAAGAGAIITAAVLARLGPAPAERALGGLSPGVLACALGVAIAAQGVYGGPWLVLIGAEALALGVGMLVFEARRG